MKKEQLKRIRELSSLSEEHDYDPSWDYDVIENPDEDIKRITSVVISKINKDIISKIDMVETIEVSFVNLGEDGTLSRYIDGTRTNAVFVLDVQNVLDAAEEYSVDIETVIETTLVHEIGHAIQDILDLRYDEDDAEDFAYKYHYLGMLPKFWEK